MTFANSTKAAYRTHLRVYAEFCKAVGCKPLPISTENLSRFAAYLARTRATSSVRQYLNIARIVHLEFGLDNPLNSWQVKSVLGGVKRGKGDPKHQKLPITVCHLHGIHKSLHLDQTLDLQFWAACLTGFFGLLRVSNFTCRSNTQHGAVIRRQDITFTSQGCILTVRKSKTNQFAARTHEVVLPYLADSTLCPTTALMRLIGRSTHAPITSPLCTYWEGTRPAHLLQAAFRKRLTKALQDSGTNPGQFSTHSLRRGGATWLISVGTPLTMVKCLGDWRSDAVFDYIKPSTGTRFNVWTQNHRQLRPDA